MGSQVKRLLSGVSTHGNQHLTEVETDLAQTTFLLDEAIQKLGASFMAIHEAVCAQQKAVELLLAGDLPSAENAAQLKAMHVEIDKHVNAAVTGLQFQDMTSQLIHRTMQRVSGLREVLHILGTGIEGMMPQSEVEEVASLLHHLNAVLDNHAEKLESVTWKPVQQTHMESGDVELF